MTLFQRTTAPLAVRLKRETRVLHRLVESTKVARAFFRGKLTKRTYAEGLARLYPVYAALEAHLDALPSAHPLAPFRLPHVFRARAILADLRFFGVAPEPFREGASARYHERVQSLVAADSPQLVAHCYVRYMADVSGGVIAGRVAQRALGLPTREGLAYLTFPQIPEPALFRDDFRARLNGFPRDEAEAASIVEEANLAFGFNRALADELWDYGEP